MTNETVTNELATMESTVTEVLKLAPKHGEVLVIRLPTLTPPEYQRKVYASFRQWLREEMPGVRLLLIVGETEVEHLSLEEMADKGWVRNV